MNNRDAFCCRPCFTVINKACHFLVAFDRLNVPIYEEVAKMPPFERKTLILIGKFLVDSTGCAKINYAPLAVHDKSYT